MTTTMNLDSFAGKRGSFEGISLNQDIARRLRDELPYFEYRSTWTATWRVKQKAPKRPA
jgi:hypothetical protein